MIPTTSSVGAKQVYCPSAFPYDSEPRSLKIAYLTHRREPKIRVDPYAKFGALSYAHYLKLSETFSTVSVDFEFYCILPRLATSKIDLCSLAYGFTLA